MMRRTLRRAAGVLGILAATLCLAELGLRALGADWRIVGKNVSFQTYDAPVHQDDPSSELRYSLRPSSAFEERHSVTSRKHGARDYQVRISKDGYRGADKPPSERALRVVALGGSTTYGFRVSDDETWPVSLEKALRQGGLEDAQVYNFGVPGYVLSQVVELGRRAVALVRPHVVVIQLHNSGARYFSWIMKDEPGRLAPLFEDPLTRREWFPRASHWWFNHSAIYRVLASITRGGLLKNVPGATNDHGTELAVRFVEELRARGTEVVFVQLPFDKGELSPSQLKGRVSPERVLSLHEAGRDEAFYDVHPPPVVLKEWGEKIAGWLVAKGLVRSAPRSSAPATAGR